MATNFTIEPAVFTAIASLVNDMTSGGVWTATSNANALITVQISAAGTPDEFQWSMNGGALSAPVAIVAATPIVLAHGLTVTFANATGHGVGDMWTILVTSAPLALGQVLRQRGFGGRGVTLQDLMEETIHVNRFGAKGDGVTDDTAAIQNAINYAQLFTPAGPGAANGGKVRLGRGTYVISSTITIPRGVQLVGETAFASVIRASADFPSSAWNSFMVVIGVFYPLQAQNTFSTGLADLTLDCGDPSYGYTPAEHISCLSIGDPVNGGINELTYIERVHLGNYTDYGMAGTIVFQLENARFGDLWVTARTGATQCKGIFLFGSTSRIHMYSVTVASVYGYTSAYPAVTLVGCIGVKIDHFHPEWCPIGILLQSCTTCSVENLYGNPSVPTDVQIDKNSNADFPPWSSTADYQLGDTVSYLGTQYTCILPSTNDTPGGSSNSYWYPFTASAAIQVRTVLSAGATYALLDYRQSSINPHSLAWDPTVSYVRLAQVSYSGLFYVSISDAPNLNNQPDVSPTWWIPGTPVFNSLDTYLDASCFTQVMGFKNSTGFGFDTFQDYPGATIEVAGAVSSLGGPDANCGIRMRRLKDGAGYTGIGFPALSTSGRSELALLMEPGTDDLILARYHTDNDPAFVMLRCKQDANVSVDTGNLEIVHGGLIMGGVPGINATVVLAKITSTGANGSLTVSGGVITAYTAPT